MNIKVVIDKSTNCNPLLSNKSAYLTFDYDPTIVNYIKTLKYRYYNPASKVWEIQEADLLNFCNIFGKAGHKINIVDIYKGDAINTKKFSKHIPEDYKFLLKPLKYQLEGIEFGLNTPNFLLADEPGLGKTLQSLYISDIQCKGKVLIIVCAGSLKLNWKKEIKKTLGKDAYILGKDGKGGGKDRLKDLENIDNIPQKYLVTNVETLSLLKYKKTEKSRSYIYPFASKINELCEKGILDGIIIDEAHLRFKSIKAHSSKALLRIDPKYKIVMTGTPVVNTPLDVYVILRWLGVVKKEVDFWKFSDTFAIKDGWGKLIGYKNLPQLSNMLRSYMLRRERKGNIDLPPRTIIDEVLEMDTKQKNLYKRYKGDYKKHIISKLKAEDTEGTLNELRKITNFPHLIDEKLTTKDSIKLERLKELLEEITSNGKKAIIFSNWTTTTRLLAEELLEYNPAYVTGEVTDENRQKEQDKFQNDPTCKIMIGTFVPLGVGLTLTAANYGIFYDEPWNQATYDQACDRCFVKGTPILTPKGLIPIEQLNVGDEVFSGSGDIVKIKDAWSHKCSDNKLVKLNIWGSNKPIICTLNHKFLVNNNWVEAKDLKPKDKIDSLNIIQNNLKPYKEDLILPSQFKVSDTFYNKALNVVQRKQVIIHAKPLRITKEFLYFCGYFIGDGYTTKYNKFGLCGHTIKKKQAFNICFNYLKSLGLNCLTTSKGEFGWELWCNNIEYNSWFRYLFGYKAKNKHFPDFVYKLNKDQLKVFLQGLLDSDGSFKGNSSILEYTTSSNQLAANLLWILQRLGYKPAVHGDKYKVITCDITKEIKYRHRINKIKSIEFINNQNTEVFDIEVEGNHTFLVNTYVVHNCYRIGQNQPVTIYNLLCKGTIDEGVHNLIRGKGAFAQYLVDGSIKGNIDNKDLLEALIGDIDENDSPDNIEDQLSEMDI